MAAAVFIPPSPHDSFGKMAAPSRRAPLASLSNATNSPHRPAVTSGSKRPRSLISVPQQENEPPQKRQMVEKAKQGPSPVPTRQQQQQYQLQQHQQQQQQQQQQLQSQQPTPANPEGRVFERGVNNHTGTETSAFQRRLVAAREKGSAGKPTKPSEGHSTKDVESIRQWQKHYRKIFPTYRFYFESISEELQAKFARQVTGLGAQEEKFFSKNVTHIVTSRQIPPEIDSSDAQDSTSSGKGDGGDNQPQTINPSLLEKNSASLLSNIRPHASLPAGINIRRDGSGNMDVLTRARQMSMKIWTIEKFQRVLSSIVDESSAQAHSRSARTGTTAARTHHQDLSQVLRNEKLGASSEREQASLIRDVVLFKGPFIYVHDVDAKVRPTIVREYPNVVRRSDGEWPQFRSAIAGKCPFVEDTTLKKELEQERVREKALAIQQQKEAQQASRSRSAACTESVKMDPPRKTKTREALQEMQNFGAGPNPAHAPSTIKAPGLAKADGPPSFPPMPERQPGAFAKPPHMMQVGREPAASGIQRSNVTSAIQSQMISSAAAAPGAKAATSREVYELKRKVLERGHTGSLSVGSIPSSHRMTDLAGTLKNTRATAPQRAAKSRAQEKLGGIQEEEDPYADDVAAERSAQAAPKKRKTPSREPKPGYCENCRDKYEDFEEHIVSRKHRKFAVTQENWTELDKLLEKLQRH